MNCKDCLHFIVCDALESNGIKKIHPIQCGCFEDKEKVKSALEKQIPKKPIKINETYVVERGEWVADYECPFCGNPYADDSYCSCCGQALEWGDGE